MDVSKVREDHKVASVDPEPRGMIQVEMCVLYTAKPTLDPEPVLWSHLKSQQ